MKRRHFLQKAALGTAASTAAGAAVLAGCGGGEGSAAEGGGAPNVQARRTLRWRLASSFPRSLDTIFGAAEFFAQRVAALTEDRLQIRVYPAGELVPGLEVLGAVQAGTVQVGHTAGYYFTGKNPALAFDTGVPFGLTVRQHNAWVLHGEGKELLRELFAEFDVVNFVGGNTGAQMGGWFRRPIASAADLRGLKMRIPGLGGRVMSALGATVQVLAGGEVYPALERGVIDAAEWVGPYDDYKLGFHEIAKNYYYPGWWEPSAALSFYVNRRAWEELPGAYQEAVTSAAHEASQNMLALYDALNPGALQQIRDAGVALHAYPDDVLRQAREATRGILDQEAGSGLGRRILDSYRAWQEQSNSWFATAEQAYATFMLGSGAAPAGTAP